MIEQMLCQNLPPNRYFYATFLRTYSLLISCSYTRVVFCCIVVCIIGCGFTEVLAGENITVDTTPLSTQKQALTFLEKQADLKASTYWPKVPPVIFLQNLKKNIEQPLHIYEGRSTNFCAYAALSYLPLHDDPLGYVKFMVKLYREGKAIYGKEYFEPTKAVKLAAGTLTFKGELDIRPADQIWFLSLADHFKGYLNFFDRHFDFGDENKMWAAVNFSKFNRMIRMLFNYHVDAVGSDLIRPGVRDVFEYLSDRLKTGNVALFVNNPNLYKKNHTRLKLSIPTHFIILLNIEEVDDRIAFTYWDYGGRSLQLLSPAFLKKIIFGISHITKKPADAK